MVRAVILLACLPLAAPAAGSAGIGAYKKLSLAQLMEIEVTSVSRRAETLGEVASAIQVVTGQDIRRAGALRLGSALRLLPNLHVAQIDARQWAIAARGFNNTVTNKLLVQLDGRTLYTPLFAGVFWDVQDTLLEDVDRVEAISGPGATQWGSNAVNGVINISTKPAKETQGGFFNASAGTERRESAAARYGGRLAAGAHYRVYAKHSARDSTAFADGRPGGNAWDTTQAGFRADWERNQGDTLTVQGDLYRGEFGQTTNADIAADGGNVLARWTRKHAPNSEISVQTYFDYTHRDIPGSIEEHLAIYDLDLHHRLRLGERNDFMWGAGYRYMNDRVRNPATLAFFPPQVKREWFNGFVQDELSLLGDRVRLTGGIKLERNPYSGTELQPSVRAAWRLQNRHLVWTAVSRALRTPSRIDREFFVPAAPPHTIAGGPRFTSEKLVAYELGYRGQPHDRFSLSLSTFFHDYDDLRSLEPATVPGGPSVIANGLTGESYGAELAADYRATDRWRLRFGYTEQRVRSRPKPGSLDRTSSRSQALDPERMVLLHSQVDLPRNVAVDVTGRFVDRIDFHDVPSYFGVDVRVSWQPAPALELAIAGRNLLDPRHPEFGAPATRQEIERGVDGSLTWRF